MQTNGASGNLRDYFVKIARSPFISMGSEFENPCASLCIAFEWDSVGDSPMENVHFGNFLLISCFCSDCFSYLTIAS